MSRSQCTVDVSMRSAWRRSASVPSSSRLRAARDGDRLRCALRSRQGARFVEVFRRRDRELDAVAFAVVADGGAADEARSRLARLPASFDRLFDRDRALRQQPVERDGGVPGECFWRLRRRDPPAASVVERDGERGDFLAKSDLSWRRCAGGRGRTGGR